MIYVIHIDSSDQVVDVISMAGNEEFLSRDDDLKLLSGVDEYSYMVIDRYEADELLNELNIVKNTLSAPEAITHTQEIIVKVQQCKEEQGMRLMFSGIWDGKRKLY